MKKIMFTILLGGAVLGFNKQVWAAEYKAPEKAADVPVEDVAFIGLEDTDKVVKLSDGTFLHGEATIGKFGLGENELTVVNSETAPNAVTVEVAKEILEKDKESNVVKPTPRGIVSSFNYKGLGHGASVSGHFARNRGWNSLNTVYQSTANGPYLRYYSGYDSAMVGTAQQATQTFSGRLSGTLLPANSYNYYPGINTMYTYYGSAPSQWQAYQIINI